MRFSLWTQIWKHSEVVTGDKKKIQESLHVYYMKSAASFTLIRKHEDGFGFSRGSKLVSAFALGDETWAYHVVEVRLSAEGGKVRIDWDIDLKLFGVQAGENAIIAECKRLAKSPQVLRG